MTSEKAQFCSNKSFRTNLDNCQFFALLLKKKYPEIFMKLMSSWEWKEYTKSNVYDGKLVRRLLKRRKETG